MKCTVLTVRPFRNEDPPRLLKLWQDTQRCRNHIASLPFLSLERLQTQVLGLPMLDCRSIMLAFDGDVPVGYIHTTLAPDKMGHSFDTTVGQICFLCVDSAYSGAAEAAQALIRAGEDYLLGLGAQTVFGGSPSPSAPFYTAMYGGSEAIAILHSDEAIINAFHEANYKVDHTTTWFYFDLQNYTPIITAETVGYYNEIEIEIREVSKARNWWEGCTITNGIWFDATAFLIQTKSPIARLRARITYPDTGGTLTMYEKTWLASLIDLRVHPQLADDGIQEHLLREVIQYLAAQNQIVQIEAHARENSPLYLLLRRQSWMERDSGSVFIKDEENLKR